MRLVPSENQVPEEPDWEPLEDLLYGWMFMGYVGDIRLYKNCRTRHYLNVDSSIRCYQYNGDGSYSPVSTVEAVAYATGLRDWDEYLKSQEQRSNQAGTKERKS